MKKKLIIIISIILLLIVSIIFIINYKKEDNNLIKDSKEAFYLENEYYNNNGLVDTNMKEVNDLLSNKKSFILFTYNNFCQFRIPCDSIFESVAKENNIEILQVPFTKFKDSTLNKYVKYAPSVILISDGMIVDYLDSNSDSHLDLYQDTTKFKEWLLKYVKVK